MRGRAFVFGDDINTDEIIPSEAYTDLYNELDSASRYVFEPIRPDFTDEVETGDIVVAGENFGSGSGRESAPVTMEAAGVGAVIAESFARIFYRNAIAVGLPTVTCPDVTDLVSEGDVVEADIDENTVRNVTTGAERSAEPLPEEVRAIFDSGGLMEHLEKHPDGLRIE